MELDPVEGKQRETGLEMVMELDPEEGRQRETNGERPQNHDGIGSNGRKRIHETSLEIRMDQTPFL